MKIKEEPIKVDNIFEQIALMTKKKLVDQGVLPSDADKIAVEFVKERGINVINNVCKKK